MIEGRLLKLGHVAASMVAFLLASSMAVGVAQATTMYRMSLSELTFVSDLIVLAEVEQSSPEKAPGDLYIKTVAT